MTDIPAFDLIVFGGTGNLARRKLFPALYYRHREGHLPEDGRVVGLGRSAMDRGAYVELVRRACREFVPLDDFDDTMFETFAARLDYLDLDAADPAQFERLHDRLGADPGRVRVFYLAMAPSLFAPTCAHLGASGLAGPCTRVVLEKPIGTDLASATRINAQVGEVFAEHQIYRIDHYLGKETVQNLMALRFGNTLFEPMWSRGAVRDVQITVAETIGVEGRGEYYDRVGAMRDMVQNHLLQVMCIIAMEPPISSEADAVRDEKLKVLRALRPLAGADALRNSVRGQYRAGAAAGQPVPGYVDEPGIGPDSTTETFVALRAEIGSWRWAGVPFYLRTGKRLPERVSEIVINFRAVPHLIFEARSAAVESNRLVIRLQPDDGVHLHLMAKARGDEMRLRPVELNLDFADTFKSRLADAYEPLLMDVLRGRPTLFMRRDEVDAAWRWVEPILQAWGEEERGPRGYTAGTWGPSAAGQLVGRDGAMWPEEA